MGRAPCCDKANVKKGPWSPEEDDKLKSYIEKHGTGGNWIALPQKIGLKRCGKSCRLRWLNYLRPNIKHGGFSQQEDNIICSLYISIGSRWSIIAAQLPGRTDNDIKNYWNTRLKKKLLGKQRKEKHEARTAERSSSKQIINSGLNICQGGGPMGYGPQPITTSYSNIEETVGFKDDDHASIRKLLTKLGGRFSNNTNIDESSVLSTINQPAHDYYSVDLASNSSAQIQIPLLNNASTSCGGTAPFVSDFDHHHHHHHHHHPSTSSMLHDANDDVNLTAEMYENPDHKLQVQAAGLEFIYDDIINSGISTTCCGESMEYYYWGDQMMMNSNLVSSNNQGFLQGSTMLEEFVVHKARYPGNQSSS